VRTSDAGRCDDLVAALPHPGPLHEPPDKDPKIRGGQRFQSPSLSAPNLWVFSLWFMVPMRGLWSVAATHEPRERAWGLGRLKSGAEATAVQTLARTSEIPVRREASGLRRLQRRCSPEQVQGLKSRKFGDRGFSPAGRGGKSARARSALAALPDCGGMRSSLSQRERAGVREDAFPWRQSATFSVNQHKITPLITAH